MAWLAQAAAAALFIHHIGKGVGEIIHGEPVWTQEMTSWVLNEGHSAAPAGFAVGGVTGILTGWLMARRARGSWFWKLAPVLPLATLIVLLLLSALWISSW